MATVTHVIRSHYNPVDRDKLERETGQHIDDQSDPWQTESSHFARRRIRAAPHFVPATISHDERGVPPSTASSTDAPKLPGQPSASTAAWYRSLTASASHAAGSVAAPSHLPGRASQDVMPEQKVHRESVTVNDWFIQKALRSESSTRPASQAPSLAELLARDPPPLPSEPRYIPPAWLHIGPSNRGFGMLQRSGWTEGEGLGAHVTRKGDADGRVSSAVGMMEHTCEVAHPDSDTPAPEDSNVIRRSVETIVPAEAFASHMQRTLLTPLPTILKTDRLGIGLKAKTEGPYKQSRKRVTHSAAALAAHIRSAEELRREKAAFGRGKRGFANVRKMEEDRRKTMLAYLNE